MEVDSVTKVNKTAPVKLMGSSGLQQEVTKQITEQLEAIVVLEQDRKRKERIHCQNIAKRRRIEKEEDVEKEKESAKDEDGDEDMDDGRKKVKLQS